MKEIVDKLHCTGCTLCAAACPCQAITMTQSTKGFLYPIIDQNKCIDCKLCRSQCPAINFESLYSRDAQEAYAVQHYNSSIVFNSSSGGAFTALSDQVLKMHGVIYGAVYTPELHVKHIRAADALTRNAMRDSKYVQSDLTDVFAQILADLKNGTPVLFTGTPCQCAGLRAFLKRDYKQCFIVEIFCHSAPSPKIFADHLRTLEKKHKSKAVAYTSRNKRYGWTRHDCITFQNGTSDDSSMLSQMYYELFNRKLIARDSCYVCPFAGKMRCADLSIGDFWGYREASLSFKNKQGISILLANTENGKNLLSNVRALQMERISLEKAFCKNHSKPITNAPSTNDFWNEYVHNGYLHAIKKYAGYSLRGRMVFMAKRIRRQLRHAFHL